MALDATPGGSSANSYCTVAEADAYFNTSYNRTVWTSATTPNKEVALIEASRLLDNLVSWRGYLVTNTQNLRWPRAYVTDSDGFVADGTSIGGFAYLSSEVIPRQIKEIAYELAYSILSNSGYSAEENDITSVKVGGIRVDFSERVKNQGFPQNVRDLISNWGEYAIRSSNEIHAVSLSRV